MVGVAVSSFWITSRSHWSWIHGLSAWVLAILPLAWIAARRGRIRTLRRAMLSIFIGGLVVAGAFTLLPGRIMHAVVFGA